MSYGRCANGERCHKRKKSSRYVAMGANFWSRKYGGQKRKTWTCMTLLCMTALRNQTAGHTFLPLFDHAYSSFCQKRLFTGRSINFATMVTRCNISPLYCHSLHKTKIYSAEQNNLHVRQNIGIYI